ncbi:MAG: SEC-C metal-binding domain-containing protein [Planctomycetota bacterium]|jgi:uncharacterized protein YecA (UPF0149 family)
MEKQNQNPKRNQLCHCDSGKKYKKCHGSADGSFPRQAKDYGLTLIDAREIMKIRIELEQMDIIYGLVP